ncbi:MAG: acetylxylan esterase [Bryobacteraceae bacterium]
MMRFANSILVGLLLLVRLSATDTAEMRRQVDALGRMHEVPKVYPAEGWEAKNGVRALFFESVAYRGKPTRVFAWYGAPQKAGKHPGIVLVHGGGGSAYREWVEKWVSHGFAAISIAVEGQTDRRNGKEWQRSEWGGPARDGIYGDTSLPLEEQWMYHAVAATVRANSLLRGMPEVDAKRVGVGGISWGGVITSTVMGLDSRFAFAIPIYGCGYLHEIENHWGKALHDNTVYKEVWAPELRLGRARMPALWLTWLRDPHFALDAQEKTYRAAPGPRMVSVIPDMKHSHVAGWNPPDSYAFAEGIVRDGKPWLRQLRERRTGAGVTVEFVSSKPVEKVELIYTPDTGLTTNRDWKVGAAEVQAKGSRVEVRGTIPAGTTAAYFLLHSGDLHGSSELMVFRP